MPSNLQAGISSVLSSTGQAVAVGKHIQTQQKIAEKQEVKEQRELEQHFASLKVKEAQVSLKKAQAEAQVSKAGLMEQQKAILEAKETDRKKDLKRERFRKTLKNKKENAILEQKMRIGEARAKKENDLLIKKTELEEAKIKQVEAKTKKIEKGGKK